MNIEKIKARHDLWVGKTKGTVLTDFHSDVGELLRRIETLEALVIDLKGCGCVANECDDREDCVVYGNAVELVGGFE